MVANLPLLRVTRQANKIPNYSLLRLDSNWSANLRHYYLFLLTGCRHSSNLVSTCCLLSKFDKYSLLVHLTVAYSPFDAIP